MIIFIDTALAPPSRWKKPRLKLKKKTAGWNWAGICRSSFYSGTLFLFFRLQMGSFRIISFLALCGFTGLISLISILIRSALTDTTNVLVSNNMLSVDTVNTLTTILTVTQWAPVIAIIALAIWAVSGHIGEQQGDE